MRILKINTCPSISGKSTLTYHIGCDDKSDLHIRINANTGTGFFSKEWVAMKDIEKAIHKDAPITSIVLYPLFRGKSVNTPAFLLAVLIHEKLLQPMKGKRRSFETADSKKFYAAMEKLIASGKDLSESAPKKAMPKTRKKSLPRS